MFGSSSFPRAAEVIQSGLQDGTHLGAQLYVSLARTPLAELAFGDARGGTPMTTDTWTLWFSAGKPLTAVAAAQLVERGELAWDTPVVQRIPEFGQQGKDRITVRHLLTHTAGLHVADDFPELPWRERIAQISAAPLPDGWVPGQRAAYSSRAGSFILGELVSRVSGRDFPEYVTSRVTTPAQLNETRLVLRDNELETFRDKIGFMYDTTGAPTPLNEWNSDDALLRCIPGGSARGPIRQLGRLYETFLTGGAPLLYSDTVRAMTSRQRAGMLDETFQYKLDMGLGFILNSNRDGMQMPYGYGRSASPDTFGHSGNQASCAFADPTRDLVVAWACNGMPGERRHQQRQRAINNALYEDLEAL